MEDRNFLKLIQDARKDARTLKTQEHNINNYTIVRGMAHSISGYVEDLFAVYMAHKFNTKKLEYLVDKVISIKQGATERATTFKPDLFVSPGPVMTHYFDLKTSLGWERDKENYLVEKDRFVRSIRGKDAWISFHGDKPWNLKISEELKYQMVVAFGGNINQDQLQNNMEKAKQLECVEMYVLSSDGKKTIPEEFDRLYNDSMKLLEPYLENN